MREITTFKNLPCKFFSCTPSKKKEQYKRCQIVINLIKFWAQRYLARKKFGKIFKCVYLSLFMITKLFLKSKSLLLFKLNQLMVPIGKKSAPDDHESSLKIFLAKLFLARCPCALFCCIYNQAFSNFYERELAQLFNHIL